MILNEICYHREPIGLPWEVQAAFWHIGENGDAFPGMIASRPGGIAAMIRSDDEKIIGIEGCQELWQLGVKLFKRGGIADHIAAVTVKRVEVHIVGDDEIAIAGLCQRFERHGMGRLIAACFHFMANRLMGKDIGDFPNGEDLAAACDNGIEQGGGWGRDGIVAPMAGPLKASCRLAIRRLAICRLTDEGTSDDAANVEGVEKPSCDCTNVVKALKAEVLLMGGNLKDRVAGCVADWLSRLHMGKAEARDDLGTRCMTIA